MSRAGTAAVVVVALVGGTLGYRQYCVLRLDQAFVDFHHGIAERVLSPVRGADAIPSEDEAVEAADALAAELGLELLEHAYERHDEHRDASGSGHVDRVRSEIARAQESAGHDVDGEGNVVAAPPPTTILDVTNVYFWARLRGRSGFVSSTRELEGDRDYTRR